MFRQFDALATSGNEMQLASCLFEALQQLLSDHQFRNIHMPEVKKIVEALNVSPILTETEHVALLAKWKGLKLRAAQLSGNQRDFYLIEQMIEPLVAARTVGSNTIQSGLVRYQYGETKTMSAGKALADWKRANQKVIEFIREKEELDGYKISWLNNILRSSEPSTTDYGYQSTFAIRPGRKSVRGGEAELEDAVKWYNLNKRRMHSVALAALMAQRIDSYHVFVEANGRTSRLVLDWILMSNGYPPASWTIDDYNLFVLEVSPAEAIRRTTEATGKSLDILEARPGQARH